MPYMTSDPEFEQVVTRDVIDLILDSSNGSSTDTAAHDPPLIVDACKRLIETLHSCLQHGVPQLAVVTQAVANLQSFSLALMSSSRPSTPPNLHTSSTMVVRSPRARQACVNAQRCRDAIGDEWEVLAEVCTEICNAIRNAGNNPSNGELHSKKIAWKIDNFLDFLGRHRIKFESHFPQLDHFDHLNASHRQTCMESIRNAITRTFDWPLRPSPDQVLYYVLLCLPLVSTALPMESAEEDVLRTHFAQQLTRPYRGDAHHRLLNFVRKVNRLAFQSGIDTKDTPYFKGTSIVQSSGTGKTRMVLQLGQLSPLLFLCIRPQGTSTVRSGFPLGDKPIMDFVFEEAQKTKTTSDEQAAVLLAAWFDTLAAKLATHESGEDKFHFLTQLNGYAINDHLRELFFNEVLEKALDMLPRTSTKGGYQVVFATHLDQPVVALSKQLEQVQNFLARNNSMAQEYPVFVAIDECVELPQELLVSIRRAWNHIGKLEQPPTGSASHTVCFWLILLSTNSSASTFVRPQREWTSDRERSAVALPTFVGVGFDVLRSEQTVLGSAGEAAAEQHVRLYGRPLWDSLLPERLWPVATKKLQGTETFQRGIPETCFNILASRLALRFVPIRSASGLLFGEQLAFAHKAVDRHMRMLVKVDADACLHIRSPSEPVLAIAASLIMMPTPVEEGSDLIVPGQEAQNRYGSILETLNRHCLSSAKIDILKGTRGEMMARLLLMAAWDAAKVSAPGYPAEQAWATRANYLLEPVQLQTILDNLAQLDEHGSRAVCERIGKVCNKVRTEMGGSDQVHAWTHFTHFDLLETKVAEIAPEYLWYCWKRGVAIQMAHPQHGIDGIIPVFVGDLKHKFADQSTDGELQAARQMTYVAWEAKNRQVTSRKKAEDAAGKPMHAGPVLRDSNGGKSELSDRGLLTMLLDMGAPYQPAGVRAIHQTDSLQVWVGGIDDKTVYPCLDTLNIRNAVVNILRTVATRADYEQDNVVLNPMDLDQVHHRASHSEADENRVPSWFQADDASQETAMEMS